MQRRVTVVEGCQISPEARVGPGAEKIEWDHRNRIEHYLDERLTSHLASCICPMDAVEQF